MPADEIRSIVIGIVREVQTLSGRAWSGVGSNTKPIGDLDGFDSLNAVEATVMVEEKLGCGNLGVDSIFISEDGKRALTLGEVAQRVSTLLAGREGKP